MSIKLLQQTSLELPADSAEFCPVRAHHDCLAVGTYKLNEATRERDGLLSLFQVMGTDSASKTPDKCTLMQICKLSLPGIFDIKWQSRQATINKACLAAALADGSVKFFTYEGAYAEDILREGSQAPILQECAACETFPGAMCLSLCWSNQQATEHEAAAETVIATSCSSGDLAILRVREADVVVDRSWHAHDLEAWTVAMDNAQPNLVFSGADDAVFAGHDLRSDLSQPVFSLRRGHNAGVTTISPYPATFPALLTGSYDDSVRAWDLRFMSRPVNIAQVGVGGGVWRLRPHPHKPEHVLVAAMYGGAAVLRATPDLSSLTVAAHYGGHGSIVYGAHWMLTDADAPEGSNPEAERQLLAATCSFYDQQLHLWTYQA